MSEPEQLPICNGGPETLSRADGTYEWVGYISVFVKKTVHTEWKKEVSQHEQAELAIRQQATQKLKDNLGDMNASIVFNAREVITSERGQQDYFKASLHLTGDAFRFIPNGESS